MFHHLLEHWMRKVHIRYHRKLSTYAEKTPGCLPKTLLSSGWNVTYTLNHWANEATMMDYVYSIFFPNEETIANMMDIH